MNKQNEVINIVKGRARETLSKGQYPNGLNFNVIIVWSCYILGNEKYLLTTDLPDGKYYEVTYNRAKDEIYLDEYVRVYNEVL